MRVFDFGHAIVRTPGRSVVDGLRDDPDAVPSFEKISQEHTAYVAALRAAGLDVDVLPALEAFPDSVYVEDPALVMPEGAILLSPGAPSRLAEREEMRGVMQRHFDRVLELGAGDHVDGGDILIVPDTIFIGLSKRTSRAGAEALQARLRELGRASRIAETPPAILHFKTASALLGEDTILATPALAASGIFDGFNILLTPTGEEAAANALRVNDTVFIGDSYPRTRDLVRAQGFDVVALPVTETAKLDAGLSCMSLRWGT
ncbi:MAG TPA: arginine deiminase family protein [Rhizomicrobium sp.]|jgi:dimethylargininase|nr:arginine deiminase family protein [Rhizomicrobium sp.]